MKQLYLESFFKRGYRRLMQYISNITHLDKKIQEVIWQRVKVIEFFNEFGKEATKKAFKVGLSTVYLWKSKLTKSGGKLLSLKPGFKAPKNRSRRSVLSTHLDFILAYRKEHPGAD